MVRKSSITNGGFSPLFGCACDFLSFLPEFICSIHFGDRIHDRKAGQRQLDDGAQDDAGQQLADQRRLLKSNGLFAKCPGDEQENQKDIENFHGYPSTIF
jgi:hypothetical protein